MAFFTANSFFSAFSKMLTKRTFVRLLFLKQNQSRNAKKKFFWRGFSSKTKNAFQVEFSPPTLGFHIIKSWSCFAQDHFESCQIRTRDGCHHIPMRCQNWDRFESVLPFEEIPFRSWDLYSITPWNLPHLKGTLWMLFYVVKKLYLCPAYEQICLDYMKIHIQYTGCEPGAPAVLA